MLKGLQHHPTTIFHDSQSRCCLQKHSHVVKKSNVNNKHIFIVRSRTPQKKRLSIFYIIYIYIYVYVGRPLPPYHIPSKTSVARLGNIYNMEKLFSDWKFSAATRGRISGFPPTSLQVRQVVKKPSLRTNDQKMAKFQLRNADQSIGVVGRRSGQDTEIKQFLWSCLCVNSTQESFEKRYAQ